MLGLGQGIQKSNTKVWSPADMLTKSAGSSYWFTSSYGTQVADGTASTHGDTLEFWYPRTHPSQTTRRVFRDESNSTKEFLNDRGYVYSTDEENSKWTLHDGSLASEQVFSMPADLYLCWRVKFGTLNTGSDHLCNWEDNAGQDFVRIQDNATIRGKIANGANRNWSFAEETFVQDTWYNIEMRRVSGDWTVTVNGTVSETEITDSGTMTVDRIFAIADGHISDFLILIGSTPSQADIAKLRTWLNKKKDQTYGTGALTT
jgi:hypothetical protein